MVVGLATRGRQQKSEWMPSDSGLLRKKGIGGKSTWITIIIFIGIFSITVIWMAIGSRGGLEEWARAREKARSRTVRAFVATVGLSVCGNRWTKRLGMIFREYDSRKMWGKGCSWVTRGF